MIVWAASSDVCLSHQGGAGRDHNPGVQTVWMAGGRNKGGRSLGHRMRSDTSPAKTHITFRDLHATILPPWGWTTLALTYLYNGRYQRLTENGGVVIKKALA